MPYCFLRSSIRFQGHTGQNNANFDPNWAFQDCNSSLNSPMGLKWIMMHKAWCSIGEVPYCFSRSSIKFQGHTGWKIDDLNPIWVILLGRSQLTNPSDLPCCMKIILFWYPFHLDTNALPSLLKCVVVIFSTLFCHFQMDLIQSDPEIPSLTQTTQILASLTRSQTATLTFDSESDSVRRWLQSIWR